MSKVELKNIVVGVTGATGTCLAAALLERLRAAGGWRTHLIVSPAGRRTAELEYGPGVRALEVLADVVCDPADISNAVASGTFRTEGMIIVPCSMKTAAGIVSGYSDNLLLRAADVTLKERRRLVLVPRETPLSPVHCRNLLELAQMGCVLIPPMLTYCIHPQRVEDMTVHIAGKILDAIGVYDNDMRRWETPPRRQGG